MCDKTAYRPASDNPRTAEELWALSPHNPKNREKEKAKEG